MDEFDLIIIGGGISGFSAAVAALRAGAKTLIVEQYGFLGGMLTAAGVGPMMTFHAGDKQVVKGIPDELIENLKKIGKSPGHIPDSTGHTSTVTPFDAEAMKYVMERMILDEGGKILYHASLLDVMKKDASIDSVRLFTKNGTIEASAKVFVDATGDADLSFRVGVPCQLGYPEDNSCQALTMNMRMSNVDTAAVRSYIKEHPDDFPNLKGRMNILDSAVRLSVEGFETIADEGKKRGEYGFGRGNILFFETNNPGEVIVNSTRVNIDDPTNPWELSYAESEGRRQCIMTAEFLNKNVPGFENAVFLFSGPVQIGVRSSRQIKGIYTITPEDIINCRRFDDVIANGGYPIDIHPPKNGFSGRMLELMEQSCDMEPGYIYSIPYRSLINDFVPNLITVGRCISCTFEAQGAIRVSPITGAIGHAGGAAAALALNNSNDVRTIDTADLQQTVIGQNGYILDY